MIRAANSQGPDDNERALGVEVQGYGITPGPLRDVLGDELTLLVFLRHFG